MAISAYVFIECTQGKALDVCKKLSKIKGINSCHAVTGPVDVIAFIDSPDINELGKFVVEKIQSTPGVMRTSTNIVTG
ncbi:Lrp/AsnC ligand binding domain-containing protein [Candidatus Poribacteria bacterium]|nr:Lrp/AsnC ligand binding domain-containing protein [Candidatus Poribacteria bacterium]